jgi:hypothetical protein
MQDPSKVDAPLGYCMLLHASGTRMVGYFMVMRRDLRLKGALQATVDGSDFIYFKVKSCNDPTDTIQDNMEWCHMFTSFKSCFVLERESEKSDGNYDDTDERL